MTDATAVKLRCSAICCAKSLESSLKIGISTVSGKFTYSENAILKQNVNICKKCGRIFFFSEEGEIYCAIPLFSAKNSLLYKAGPIFRGFCNFNYKHDHIVSDFSACNIWEMCEVILYSAKSISHEYGKNNYPDIFKAFENSLLMSARLKKTTEFKSEIKSISDEILILSKNNSEVLKSAVLTLFILIFRICSVNYIKPKYIFGKNLELFGELKDAEEINTVKDILNIAFQRLEYAFFGKISAKTIAIEDAVKYIQNHYGEKLTLENVAQKVFISPHYLSKAFFDEKGVNFNTFLNEVRIENAKVMFKEDKLEIADIAKAVGFKDTSYFTKIFKKYTGITPTEYKMKIRLMS